MVWSDWSPPTRASVRFVTVAGFVLEGVGAGVGFGLGDGAEVVFEGCGTGGSPGVGCVPMTGTGAALACGSTGVGDALGSAAAAFFARALMDAVVRTPGVLATAWPIGCAAGECPGSFSVSTDSRTTGGPSSCSSTVASTDSRAHAHAAAASQLTLRVGWHQARRTRAKALSDAMLTAPAPAAAGTAAVG